MNLEAIEQRVLRFLKQAKNPLVPFDQLLEYLQREEDLGAFTESELLDFLRDHELFEWWIRSSSTPGTCRRPT